MSNSLSPYFSSSVTKSSSSVSERSYFLFVLFIVDSTNWSVTEILTSLGQTHVLIVLPGVLYDTKKKLYCSSPACSSFLYYFIFSSLPNRLVDNHHIVFIIIVGIINWRPWFSNNVSPAPVRYPRRSYQEPLKEVLLIHCYTFMLLPCFWTRYYRLLYLNPTSIMVSIARC